MRGNRILLLGILVLFSVNFVLSSPFGYDTESGGVNIDTSTNNNYFNGSNINLTTTTCSGTDKVISINNATGVVTCGSDQGTINTTEQLQDAIGTGFTGNLSYDDANNLFDISSTNMLAWLENIFPRISTLIDRLGNWSADKPSYTPLVTLNNGSYFNGESVTWGDLGNGTVVFATTLNNGTYVTLGTLNNGTYSAVDTDTFVANYSTFLNKVNWGDVGNGTLATANSIWATLSNGTLVLYSTLNNGTYITNTVLNNGTYFNTDTFAPNYTAFLNKINWADVGNGTLALNSTFDSFTLLSVLNNGSYFNTASSGDISSINTTLDYFLYNGSDSGDVFLRFNDTRLNLSTYTLLSVLNNGTYFNTDTFAPNYTAFLNKVNWADVNNGTITGNPNSVLWGDVNNGTIFDVNKIEWGDVGNGTLALNSTFDSFTLLSVLNNGSYFNTINANDYFNKTDILGFGYYNLTDFDINDYSTTATILGWSYYNSTDFNINDYTLLTTLNNGSYFNVAETDPLAYNGTLIDNARLNNGSYFNTPHTLVNNKTCSGTDKFSAYDNVTGNFVCSTDETGTGSFDLNFTGNTGSGVITDSEIFNITGNGTANVRTYISGNDLIIEATDTTGSGGNTTEEMQDAVGSGFTGNLSYNDAGNSYDVNGANILTWLNGFYRQLVNLIGTTDISDFAITGIKIAFNSINASKISSGAINTTHILDGTITSPDMSSEFNTTYDLRWTTTSYVDTQNTSQTNAMTAQNTSQTNHINTKRDTSNFTFTQTVNITGATGNSNLSIAQGSFICLNYGCTQWIKANTTGVFIFGG